MLEFKNYRDLMGKILFILSILIFIYMIFSPFNNLVFQMDENFTIFLLKFPIWDIIRITGADVHPPLYYLICKLVLKIFALINLNLNTIYLLRLVSITPYFLILLISFFKFKKDYGWLVAGLFPFTLAVMSDFFMYFLNIRMYSWGLLFLLLSFLCFKEIMSTSDKKYWLLLTLFSVCGAYTHYYVGISTSIIYLSLFIYLIYNNRSQIKFFILSVISSVILYIPWVLILAGQLKKVHNHFWIPPVDLNLIIDCFSYFGPRLHDFYLNCLLILVLIIFFAIFIHQSKSLDNVDKWYIGSGFGIFIGTIIIGVILSEIYKPILITRYLIPSISIFWFVVSILISKIKDKKLFVISIILIGLLCISGINSLIVSNESLINWGSELNNTLDEINSEEGTIVVLSNPTSLAYFAPFLDNSSIYIPVFDSYLNEDSGRIHKFYDFKESKVADINKLFKNKGHHKIYLIEAYSELNVDDKYRENPILIYGDGMNFYRVN